MSKSAIVDSSSLFYLRYGRSVRTRHDIPSYRYPLMVVGVGSGFVIVGAVPISVPHSMGTRSSATMIDMEFFGFGFLLLAPGLVWCVTMRTLHSFKQWRRRSMRRQQERNQSAISAGGGSSLGDGVVRPKVRCCVFSLAAPILQRRQTVCNLCHALVVVFEALYRPPTFCGK